MGRNCSKSDEPRWVELVGCKKRKEWQASEDDAGTKTCWEDAQMPICCMVADGPKTGRSAGGSL